LKPGIHRGRMIWSLPVQTDCINGLRSEISDDVCVTDVVNEASGGLVFSRLTCRHLKRKNLATSFIY
jgi:hypothetical protein